MKKIKSILAFLLTFFILLSYFIFTSSAKEEKITVNMVNYNVAGLPNFSGKNVKKHQGIIANQFIDNDYDIIAVQEDFGYHKHLVKSLTEYEYQTNHSGSIPGGDGLNVFTKSMPIYNETRYEWNDSFGPISEGDTLTPKGIIYTVIDIGNGVYIDFYNIHADAFDSEGSVAARKSNFNQLAELIEKNYEKYGRPVIVTGDFNAHLHIKETSGDLYDILLKNLNLKEAWIEFKNKGNYHDFTIWEKSGTYTWGNWDSVEKFMYKDGKNIKVEAISFEYKFFYDENEELLSDHAAAECIFEFTIDNDFISDDTDLEIVKVSPFRNFLNTIKWIFKDLGTVLSSLGEFFDFIA